MSQLTILRSPVSLRTLGGACTASGVLGVGIGVLTLAYPPAVPAEQWSYPFTLGAQWAVSLVLVGTHLLTALGFVGILRADPHRGRRAATIGLEAAVVGFVLLGLAELLSGVIGGVAASSSAAAWVGGLFGVSSLLTAFGGLVAGVVIARRGEWRPRDAWLVLAPGLLMLLVVTPANVAGDLVPRTLALILWSVPFIPLGRVIAGSAVR